jgi:Ribonuclease toxin, BrnT, of type II toxin-antitoxin system
MFEWDTRKAAVNANKHGVTFEEAATVFNDPQGLGRCRKHPDHHSAAAEPEGTGGVHDGVGLTSPTSPRRPTSSSGPCAAWDVPPWEARRGI